MKRKMVLRVLAFLLVLQAQTVFAADYSEDFCKELNRNNIGNIERLLQRRAGQMDLKWCMSKTLTSPQKYDKDRGNYNTDKFNEANRLDVLKLLVRYGADVNRNYYYYFSDGTRSENEYPLEYAVKNKLPLAVIQFLLDSGANPNLSHRYKDYTYPPPLYSAYRNGDMALVNLLLDKGANGELLLEKLGEKTSDNQMIQLLISRGVQVRSEAGAQALRWAAYGGNLYAVILLVANGVNINARANDKEMQEYIPLGATAASIAYDKGEMDIYDFLKDNGARDFEPRQVTQQPAAPASAAAQSVQQSAPAPAPAQSATAQPQRNIGKEIADSINRAFEAPIENGRYRVSGGTMELSFAGIAKAGNVYYKDASGTTHNGTYSIDGTRITINVMSRSFFYTVTSKTSFSGNGESWFRVGF